MTDELYSMLADFLYIFWRGISSDFKSTYARKIWRVFEDNIRAAALHTADLKSFTNELCRALDIMPGANQKDREFVLQVLGRNLDRILLGSLRGETSYLILLVRQVADSRRAELRDLINFELDGGGQENG